MGRARGTLSRDIERNLLAKRGILGRMTVPVRIDVDEVEEISQSRSRLFKARWRLLSLSGTIP